MRIKTLLIAGAAGFLVLGGRIVLASDSTTPPVIVDRDDRDLMRDLKGAPPEIKALILNFDQKADDYLAAQKALLAKLRKATPDQREALRKLLQANREAFLAQLKTFRESLRKDLADLRGKINNVELRRILDAARDAAADARRHRGRN